MTHPTVDDDPDYTDDVDLDQPLPDPTDPADIPPDEGDAGKGDL